MHRKIILISFLFVLMMSLWVGVIYANDNSLSDEIYSEDYGREYFALVLLILLIATVVFFEKRKSVKLFLRLLLIILMLYVIYNNCKDLNIIFVIGIFILCASFINIFIKNGINKVSASEFLAIVISTILVVFFMMFVCNLTGIKITYNNWLNTSNNITNILIIFVCIIYGIYSNIISNLIKKLDEGKNKTEDVPWKEQVKKGITEGKEIVSNKIQLILLVSICLMALGCLQYILNGYNILQIIRISHILFYFIIICIGNIGIVLVVTMASVFYSTLNRKKIIYKTVSENKIDGKRSLKL